LPRSLERLDYPPCHFVSQQIVTISAPNVRQCRRLALQPRSGAGLLKNLPCYNRPRGEGPQMTNIGSVVKLLQREHDRLTKQIKGIAAALEAFGSAYGTRKISAAGRARIAAAQRARWAKARNLRGSQITTQKRRTMSAAARKRVAEAQKKRWAGLKAKKAAKS